MSKPLNEMTKEELIYAISDILNREEMDGSCRWCNAEEMPVNLAGESVTPEDADEYRMKHEPDCAVTYIEAVLNGTYEHFNKP